MRVLLVSTYELGRQPVHVASPAARLREAGHDVEAIDIAVQRLEPDALRRADAVAISVPMHTGLRLAEVVARTVRTVAPGTPIALYGLYAAVNADEIVGGLADRVVAGEYEPQLVAWVDEVAAGTATGDPVRVDLGRHAFAVPARDLLPPLDRYARLAIDGEERLVGAVEASHGCVHRCRHCPLPAVYDGRLRIVDPDVVLADADQQVAAGARHITFGDPDFLNGPHHALRVVRGLRDRHPDVTYDITVKVEHVLKHRDLWPELAPGLAFVVSAFETTNDRILTILDKGHTAADMGEAVHLLRDHGVEIRPSWMPFTPWTTLDDLVDILDFVGRHDLVPNVDPVQLSIRLLVPDGSLLLDTPEMRPHLGDYDPDALSWTWTPEHPETDDLQRSLAEAASAGADAAEDPVVTFEKLWRIVVERAGRDPDHTPIPAGATAGRPRMTEPWFC
ncbi:MAG: CUAEP/CCAEP-tail radical SAM protein [Acidimicrobiia bacterium]|nr:CUAEP/CCAEP-tail radical SAM protein [Acidimicrobiia bacterium]